MTLTLLFIATTFVTVAQENDGLKKWKLRVMRAISVCFCIFYGAVSIGSVFDTNFGQRNGPVVSEDCIWFNGLLALAYLFFRAGAPSSCVHEVISVRFFVANMKILL